MKVNSNIHYLVDIVLYHRYENKELLISKTSRLEAFRIKAQKESAIILAAAITLQYTNATNKASKD